jgi:isochorismate pyruvate lyase
MSTSRSTLSQALSKRAAMPETKQIISPENCVNMVEVRAGVDALDRELVALLARRFAYMDAAARIKADRALVRDEARKAQVLDNVKREAVTAGLDPDRLCAVWDVLVEQSIAHELAQWDESRNA